MVVDINRYNKVPPLGTGRPSFYFEDKGKPSTTRFNRIPISVACTGVVLAVIVASSGSGCTSLKNGDSRSNVKGDSDIEDSGRTLDDFLTGSGTGGSPYSDSGGSTSGGDARWDGGPGTVGGAGGAGDADRNEPIVNTRDCSLEQQGELRCVASGSAAREICLDTLWQTTDSCADGEICDTVDTEQPGTCISASSLCAGNAGQKVCIDGVMHTCDENGVSVFLQRCESQALCLTGSSRGTCAACNPITDFRCKGSVLERCSETGDIYDFFEQCADQNLCNADAKACTDAFCLFGQFICRDNVLMKCNAEQTAWDEVTNCGDAICDEKYGRCDICVPSYDTKCTEDGKPAVCSSDGQEWNVGTCSDPRFPVCAGQGKCVACKTKDDCGEASECNKFECGDYNNCIEISDAALNDSVCGADGQGTCYNGTCVGCIDDTDCRAPTGACTEDNRCVPCLKHHHCGADFCLESVTPSNNECVECRSQDSGDCAADMVCKESSHTCVDCLQPSDCGDNTDRWLCQNDQCVEHPTCGDGVLDTDFDEQCDDGSPAMPQTIPQIDGCNGMCAIDTTFACKVVNPSELYRSLLRGYVWTVPVDMNTIEEGDKATCAFPCNDPSWSSAERDWRKLFVETEGLGENDTRNPNYWIAGIPTSGEVPGSDGVTARCMNGALLIECKNGFQCPLGYRCVEKSSLDVGNFLAALTEDGNGITDLASFWNNTPANQRVSTKTFCEVDPNHSYWNGYAWP